jgi:hypothetical protein
MITLLVILGVGCCWGTFCLGVEIGRHQGEKNYAAKIKGDDTDHCRFTFGNIKNRED